MTEWTKSAEAELERYFDQIRGRVAAEGAEPSEVIDDIRRHVEEEIASAKLQVVTEEDIRRILRKIGTPEPLETPTQQASWKWAAAHSVRAVRKRAPEILILLFGILLPILTLGIEVMTHFCGETLFDPIPTLGHILLVALVPVTNILVWNAVRRERATHLKQLGWLSGAAIGVASFYTLLFLPLIPVACITVIYLGVGFLPLTPILSLLATLLSRRHLRRTLASGQGVKVPGLWGGIGLSLLVLVGMEAPSTITRIGLRMAASHDAERALRGIRILRSWGSEEDLLRLCYVRPARATDLLGFLFSFGDPVQPDEVRKIYYRVTGKAFNEQPPPEQIRRGRQWQGFERDLEWDSAQGGEDVAGQLRKLTLASSRMDGVIEGDAGLAYTEWTLTFRNDNPWQQREARAQILLPPGGFVSRLTLWVNGEEREAAFAARGKVRQAYQEVVEQRRDPVLVTTRGPDRVLVQCFPVPPGGGEMKIRVGITSPLVLDDARVGFLRLPSFLERNFSLPEDLRHSVWVESRRPLDSTLDGLPSEHPEPDLYACRGNLTNPQIAGNQAVIRVQRDPAVLHAWKRDSREEGFLFRSTHETEPVDAVQRMILVVDGSERMKDRIDDVAGALASLPEGIDCSVLLASDEVEDLTDGIQKSGDSVCADVAGRLRNRPFRGGCDNVPALLRAWDLAAESPHSAILWIHGPHPILFEEVELLIQRWERRPNNPHLYEIQIVPGPNQIAEKLDGILAVSSVPRLGDLKTDIARLVTGWKTGGSRPTVTLARIRADSIPEGERGRETSSHLARLWAYRQVLDLLGQQPRKTDEAAALAASYQLVTPVTGAVVLETREQYTQAGLEPVGQGSVPTIPEPETWILLLVAACVLAWGVRRRVIPCRAA